MFSRDYQLWIYGGRNETFGMSGFIIRSSALYPQDYLQTITESTTTMTVAQSNHFAGHDSTNDITYIIGGYVNGNQQNYAIYRHIHGTETYEYLTDVPQDMTSTNSNSDITINNIMYIIGDDGNTYTFNMITGVVEQSTYPGAEVKKKN